MSIFKIVQLGRFKTFNRYQIEHNRQVLLSVLLVSVIVEIIYFLLGNLAILISGNETNTFLDAEYLKIGLFVLIVYGILFMSVYRHFSASPTIVGFITMGFVLFQKLILAVANPDSMAMPIMWLVLIFLFALYYLEPAVFVLHTITSYLLYLYNTMLNPYDMEHLLPMVWVMGVSAIASSFMSLRTYTSRREDFNYRQNLATENEKKLNRLTTDKLTGVHTKYALEQYVKETLPEVFNDHTYLVMVDLDDTMLCNRLYGYEVGDIYIKSVGRLLKFLEKGDADIVSRSSGDRFTALLGTYLDISIIEKRLERYSQMLITEFVQDEPDNRFVPHFSFAIGRLDKVEDYLTTFTSVESKMYDQKHENKKHLTTSNYYLPYVNLTTLFDESTITVIAWKYEEGWPVGFVTSNIRDLLGYTNEEVLSEGFLYTDILHPEDLVRVGKEVKDYIANRVSHFEQTYRLKNAFGHYVWIRDYSVPVWADNEVIQINGYLHDITQTKRTENMFQHSEKLNALGRLSGGIAHDMNNQLMVIGSQIDLALEKDDLEVYKETFQRTATLVSGASDVVKQLMSFNSHNLYDTRPVNLVDIAKDMLEVLEHTFEKNIVVTASFLTKEVFVKADKSLVENALLNLSINARDAMEFGGILQLQVDKLTTGKELQTLSGPLSPGSYGVLKVKDDGKGIPDEDIEKIFEPFYTTKDKGTGIGLSAVIGVIRQHHGAVNVRSNVGKGTEFILYFPLTDPGLVPEQIEEELLDVTLEGGSLSILIIDDEPILSETLKEFLTIKGMTVESFISPVEGLDYYKRNKDTIDLVLLDMLMPEMNGEEVFNAMYDFDHQVRVMYLSGYSEGIEVGEDRQNNILGFFSKPLRMPELFDHITQKVKKL